MPEAKCGLAMRTQRVVDVTESASEDLDQLNGSPAMHRTQKMVLRSTSECF